MCTNAEKTQIWGRTQAAASALSGRHPAVKGEGEVLGAVMGLPRRRQAEAEKARLDKVRAKGVRIGMLPVRQSFRFQVARAMLPPCAAWGALVTGRSPTVCESNHYWTSWRAAIKGRLNASGRASRQLECAVAWSHFAPQVLRCRSFPGRSLSLVPFRSARQLPVPSPQAPQPTLLRQVFTTAGVCGKARVAPCARCVNRGASTRLARGWLLAAEIPRLYRADLQYSLCDTLRRIAKDLDLGLLGWRRHACGCFPEGRRSPPGLLLGLQSGSRALR